MKQPLFQQGFQEAVLQVSDSRPFVQLLQEVGQWQQIHRGQLPEIYQSLWKLNSSPEEILMAPPEGERGYLRIVQQDIPSRQHIRSDAQAWEPGGIMDLNIRIRDMDTMHTQFQRLGWRGNSNPIHWHWTGSEIKEWLAHGPDGISIALIERIAPPLEGFGQLNGLSRVINSTQIVTDLNPYRELFENVLGFQLVRHSQGTHSEPEENVFGLPHQLINTTPHEVIVFHPTGLLEGSVEFIQFDSSLLGRHHGTQAHPKNLGIATLRFPVTDMQALVQKLQRNNADIRYHSQHCELPPYGTAQITAIKMPDGAWIEFYQLKNRNSH
jgi:hypothetical protein